MRWRRTNRTFAPPLHRRRPHMSYDPVTSLTSLRNEIEAGWKQFNDVFATFDAKQWSKKFGKTWTYAEQPWHMAYFDAMASAYVGYGPNPPADKMHLRSMGELNAWNAREFAKRGPGHTVQDSLARYAAQQQTVRAQLAGMTERDLDDRAWIPLIFGWGTKRDLLQMIVVHNVAEYWKLWIRTGKRTPPPSPNAVHLRLSFMMRFMPASLNKELAK